VSVRDRNPISVKRFAQICPPEYIDSLMMAKYLDFACRQEGRFANCAIVDVLQGKHPKFYNKIINSILAQIFCGMSDSYIYLRGGSHFGNSETTSKQETWDYKRPAILPQGFKQFTTTATIQTRNKSSPMTSARLVTYLTLNFLTPVNRLGASTGGPMANFACGNFRLRNVCTRLVIVLAFLYLTSPPVAAGAPRAAAGANISNSVHFL